MLAALVLVVAGAVLAIAHDGSRSSSGIQGSGNAATETRDVAPFSAVDLAGGNNVTVHVGGAQSVVVSADDNLLAAVTTSVLDRKLVIGTTGSFAANAPTGVEVTVPSLRTLTLSGSGTLAVDGIDARRLTVTLSGSGVIRASGTVNRLDVSLTGSGSMQLAQLAGRDVRAVVSASGMIMVNASQRLDASVQGSGVILYTGAPAHVTRSITGSGAITGT